MAYLNTRDLTDTLLNGSSELDFFLNGGCIEEIQKANDIDNRKIYITFDIGQDSISTIARQIIQYNAEDKDISIEKRKPITIYLATCGGEVEAGFELVDLILASKTPIRTVCLANAYSMGFYIFIAGHQRYMLPNSKLLIHDGSVFVYNSNSKAQDTFAFQSKFENKIKSFVLNRTLISPEEYDRNARVEWYMMSDDAKKKGCTDFIIGDNCDIDEIL